MWIKKEAPAIYSLQKKILDAKSNIDNAFLQIEAEVGSEKAIQVYFSRYAHLQSEMKKVEALKFSLLEKISKIRLSESSFKRFKEAVQADLKDPSISFVTISMQSMFIDELETLEDWFARMASLPDSIFERKVTYEPIHPNFLMLASNTWSTEPRVRVVMPGELNPYTNRRHPKLMPGLPSKDTWNFVDWSWASGALVTADAGIKVFGWNLNLCDYVEWKDWFFADEIDHTREDQAPTLYKKADFGYRLSDHHDLVRTSSEPEWRTKSGTLVTPLWQYINLNAPFWCDEVCSIAFALGKIGQGIDAAVNQFSSNQEDYENHGDHDEMVLERVYHVGESVMEIRAMLELKSMADAGRRSKINSKKKGKKSGTVERKKRRVQSLLNEMERLARSGMVHAGDIEHALAKEALIACKRKNAKLWKQGEGQWATYLTEVKIGEFGEEAKLQRERILALSEQRHSR